jgi:hypothetical protein
MSQTLSISTHNRKVGNLCTFSLPALITCPGASPWCKQHCYALRLERLRPSCRNAWRHNYALTRDPERFISVMLKHLPRGLPCMRFHVSGDFYSASYIDAVRAICRVRSTTRFWAYTRGWVVPELMPALERLRALPNVTLFASVDPTMPDPPDGWRIAFVEGDPRANGLPCKEQHGQAVSCLECGYCFRASKGNVVFKIH